MNIQGIGIDIVDNDKILVSDRFAKKILTKNELIIFNTMPNEITKKNFLCSQWALKEAIYKSINNNEAISLLKIEILRKNNRPVCTNINNLFLSVSHSKTMTCAIAIKLDQ